MNNPVAIGLVLAATTVSALPTSAQTPAQIPVRIEQARIADGRPIVDLVNIGTRPIVAWGVAARVTYADGKSRSLEMVTDEFDHSVRQYATSSVLPPGGRYALVFPVSTLTAAVTVTAAPTLAVFDDDTAVGDEARLDRLFADRARSLQAWRELSALLDAAVTRSADPVSVLRDAAYQLAALESVEVRRSAAFIEFDRRVRDAVTSSEADAASAGSRLQQLRQEASSLHRVAGAHSQRRF